MVIITIVEKVFNKIYHLILIKVLSKIGIETNFYNLIQSIYENFKANITIMVKILMLNPAAAAAVASHFSRVRTSGGLTDRSHQGSPVPGIL